MKEAARIGEILRSLAPVENRSGWIAEQADAMEMGEGNFKACVYGTAAPSADSFKKMIRHFGAPFLNEYLKPFGFQVATTEQAALLDQLSEHLNESRSHLDAAQELLRSGKCREGK